MINKTIKSILTLLILIPAVGFASDLYHEKVNHKGKGGKDLTMVLDELERHENFSIVRVKYTSGASVPSIMFMVKGFYEIAKLRGEKFFINLKEWSDEDGNWMYKVGYASDKKNDPKKYFGKDIDKTKELEYLSVQELERIFERK
jgi:hypothetical protein